jgi:hypothetical protein
MPSNAPATTGTQARSTSASPAPNRSEAKGATRISVDERARLDPSVVIDSLGPVRGPLGRRSKLSQPEADTRAPQSPGPYAASRRHGTGRGRLVPGVVDAAGGTAPRSERGPAKREQGPLPHASHPARRCDSANRRAASYGVCATPGAISIDDVAPKEPEIGPTRRRSSYRARHSCAGQQTEKGP